MANSNVVSSSRQKNPSASSRTRTGSPAPQSSPIPNHLMHLFRPNGSFDQPFTCLPFVSRTRRGGATGEASFWKVPETNSAFIRGYSEAVGAGALYAAATLIYERRSVEKNHTLAKIVLDMLAEKGAELTEEQRGYVVGFMGFVSRYATAGADAHSEEQIAAEAHRSVAWNFAFTMNHP